MNKHPFTVTVAALALAALLAAFSPAQAQAQAPAGLGPGPVRITSTLPAGSGPDTMARMVAEKLQAKWARPVVVDPRPGGAGVVAINLVKAAPPTGNDLVVADVGNLSINPLIFKKLSYDPERDLVPVAVLYKTAFFVTVAAGSPYRSLKELLAAKGKGLSFGSNAVGGPIHMASARLASASGVEMMHVPYKETSQLYAAVSTGEVDWAYGTIASAGPLVRAGKLRFLAVADTARTPAMPEVPTLEEAGGPPGLSAPTWVALMAPRGTPAATVERINEAVNEALASPAAKERLGSFGFVASPGPAQQVAQLMRADRAAYAVLLGQLRVSVD